MSESILLPIDHYLEALEELNGEPLEETVLAKIAEIDPSISDAWTDEGKARILKAITQALTVPDGEELEAGYTLENIVAAAWHQNVSEELRREVLEETDDDYIEEEYNDRQLAPKITIDSFNNYEFKRYICDLLEVGCQTDSLTLISTLIDKIDPTWRLIL